MIDLSVTIVNYNTKDLLRQCIKSIYEMTREISFEIIVVDNASSDGSVEMLRLEFPGVKVIANKENLFFTKAHNQALKISKGRYLMILNSDTIILNNAFKIMVDFMDKNLDVGACGPQLLNPDMTHQGSGLAFPSFIYGLFEVLCINAIFKNNYVKSKRNLSGWDRTTLREVDTVGGACMLVRKDVINQVGLLDEHFLIYWEETDWCLRIKKAGWKIYFIPEAKVLHIQQQGMKQHKRLKNEEIFHKSMLYYYKKHYGFVPYLILRGCLLLTTPLILLKRRILG